MFDRRVSNLVMRRGFDLVECGSSPTDLLDGFVGGFVPNGRDGILVPVFSPGGDGLHQVSNASKGASTEPATSVRMVPQSP